VPGTNILTLSIGFKSSNTLRSFIIDPDFLGAGLGKGKRRAGAGLSQASSVVSGLRESRKRAKQDKETPYWEQSSTIKAATSEEEDEEWDDTKEEGDVHEVEAVVGREQKPKHAGSTAFEGFSDSDFAEEEEEQDAEESENVRGQENGGDQVAALKAQMAALQKRLAEAESK
jgi:hypothetical protein